MDAHFKYFASGNTNASFVVNDKKRLKKYNKIWNIIKDLLGKEFDSAPV